MPFLSVDLDSLEREVKELSSQKEIYRVESERLRGLLDCFDNPAFEKFRETVLIPEMQRLANLRMELPSDQTMVHERIMGQYCEAKMLAEKKQTIVQDLMLNNIRLQEQGAELGKVESKYQRELKRRTGE